MSKAKKILATVVAITLAFALVVSVSATPTQTVAELASTLNETYESASADVPGGSVEVTYEGNTLIYIWTFDIEGFDATMAQGMLDNAQTPDTNALMMSTHRLSAPALEAIRWEYRNTAGEVLASITFEDGAGGDSANGGDDSVAETTADAPAETTVDAPAETTVAPAETTAAPATTAPANTGGNPPTGVVFGSIAALVASAVAIAATAKKRG
ncbi:MAG: hypothetical protein FWF76_05215 [Oscillospiraceae bacterium]|nr:hypothetical protein [Oscillospiraceae bacterium]